MALIKCTECNKEISDKAMVCNGCGCPVSLIVNSSNNLIVNNQGIEAPLSLVTERKFTDEENKEPVEIKKSNSPKAKRRIYSVLTGIFLGVSSLLLLIILITLIDMNSLNFPQTIILPSIYISIIWIGALLLFISAIKYRKGGIVKNKVLSAFVLLAVAIVLIPISQSVNKSIISSSISDPVSPVITVTPNPTPTPTVTPSPTPVTPNITLTPSGMKPSDEMYQIASLGYANGNEIIFYNTPDIIFTTTAAENGLDGTFMYIHGTVHSFYDVEELPVLFIETAKGMIAFGFPYDFYDFAIEEGILTEPIEIDLIEIGHEYGFLFKYTGYSMLLDIPMGMYVGLDIDSIPEIMCSFGDTITFDGHEVTLHEEVEWVLVSDEQSIFRIPITISNITNERTIWQTWDNIYQLGPNGKEGRVGNSARNQFDFDTIWNLNFMRYDLGRNGSIQPGESVNTYMHFSYDGEGDYTIDFLGRRSSVNDIKLVIPIPQAPPRATHTPTAPPRGINTETYSYLRIGMSISQVRTIMGIEPSSVSTSSYEILGTRTYTTILDWSRFNPYRSITVMFSGSIETNQQVSSILSSNLD